MAIAIGSGRAIPISPVWVWYAWRAVSFEWIANSSKAGFQGEELFVSCGVHHG